ncbi:(E3-independent) E2 ubiquitin-conjugating enzyme-like isoform X2 [Lytechinus variegatus]|uniref:(E3-independent) E2 ubiquitin-conjugating enzyme-like isoform X2 n=1 Tax=Lytechinus variegatus TaxID=7654 RepID=UPI001BB1CFFF|nr:(E3-independent) E2 ubiquitin-conjugating enzyme-like isoform X2 [Lytechinus variegatus]
MATNLSKEDVVRRKHRGQIQLGLVTYSYTGDSSSEDEDDDASDIVRKGEARIAWYPKGREEVIAEDKLTLHDRCLLPGDIVKYNVPTQTQKGIIKSINVLCHLQVHSTRQMIYNIPSQQLNPIVPFQSGHHVVMDDWVGFVRESYNNVVVRFKSDARCSVCEDSACRLVDVHDSSDENSVFGEEIGFFPGQVLQGPAAVFKGAKWLGGPRPILGSKTRFRVTVDEVKNTGLDVQWCSRAITKNTDDLKPPPMCIKGKNLERTKLLNFSAHASVQIGDKFMYKVKEEDLGYPEPVTKGSLLSYRKPDEEGVAAKLESAINSVREDVDSENKDSIPSVIKEALQGLGILELQKAKVVVTEDACTGGVPESKEGQVDEAVLGDGCKESGGDGEQSVQCGSGASAASCLNSATAEMGLENNQVGASKLTAQQISSRARCNKEILKCLNSYDQILYELEKARVDDPASLEEKEIIVRQAERNLRNLPRPEDLARAFLKPAFNLVNGDEGTCSTEVSESDQERAKKPKDHRLRRVLSNFEKIHEELETLQGSLSGLASGSLPLESYNKLCADTQKDMHDQVKLLGKVCQSVFFPIEAAGEEDVHSDAEGIPNEQLETTKREKEEGVIDDVSSGDDLEWEEDEELEGEEEDQAEEIEEDGEQEPVNGKEQGEDTDSSSKAKSKTSSQNSLSKLAKRQTSSQPKKRKERAGRGDPIHPGQWVCVEVTHTSTIVDVLWQDGTYESGIVSTNVVPCRQLDELEFFPGDFVSLSKEANEEGYGVVTQADNKERTCGINWITRNPENPSEPIIRTEEHSVYELSPHSDFVFSTDDVVIRIAHNSKEEESAKDLPPAGQVRQVNNDGTITVRWVDDTVSKVFPHQLFRIEEEFDSELSITDFLEAAKEMRNEEEMGDGSHDDTSSDSSWETASGESGHEEDEEKDVCEDEDMSHAADDSVTISRTEPPDTEAQRTGEVETADKTEEPLSTNSDCSVLQQSSTDIVENKEQATAPKEEITKRQSEEQTEQKKGAKDEVKMKLEVTPPTEEVPGSQDRELIWEEDGLQSPNAASRFIVVPSLPSCHYFSSAQEPTNRKKFLQTWRKEVRLLQTALPQGILVKAFEDRMDMFSVMIEGPVNTPYEDGVFFFDIRLLGDYPKTPPKVHYLSFCSGRLNPNLYSDGKVCLSLLGTWTGKGNEMWTSSSNLLQLLVSVQGLILVNEPYYNEAGYDKHRGTRESIENCRMYNEMALVKLVQSMTKMVSSPPFLFKEETLLFLKKHSVRLIRRLESWLDLASRSEDIPKDVGQPAAEMCQGQQGQMMPLDAEDTTEDGASRPLEDPQSDVQESLVPPTYSSSSSSPSENTSNQDSLLHVQSDPATETASSVQADPKDIHPSSSIPSTFHAPSSSPEAALISPSTATTTKPEHASLEPGPIHKFGAMPDGNVLLPPYALFPLSKGFVISLQHTLSEFKSVLKQAGIS